MSPIRSRAGSVAPAGSVGYDGIKPDDRPSQDPKTPMVLMSQWELMDVLQYIHDHYGECQPERGSHFQSWLERIAARKRRSYY